MKWAYSLDSSDGLSALSVTFLFMFTFFCHVVGPYAASSTCVYIYAKFMHDNAKLFVNLTSLILL